MIGALVFAFYHESWKKQLLKTFDSIWIEVKLIKGWSSFFTYAIEFGITPKKNPNKSRKNKIYFKLA